MRKLVLAAAAALALSGCSSFTLGAFCYVPAGAIGNCEATVMPPPPRPFSAPAAPAAKKPDA